MDSSIFVIVALIAGLALGWFLGARPAADLRARLAEAEGEAKSRQEEFRRAAAELGQASIRVATLEANAASFDETKRSLIEAQESLRKEFEAAGAKILGQAQAALLERAEQRFTESEKQSAERLKALLVPVDQRLKSYEEQVGALEKSRVDAFGQLFGQIELLKAGQEKVQQEAARLGNSLRNAPKARGRWGEQQLKNLLEQCGLSEHTDFDLEHSIETEDGRLRPDAVVRIPGQKSLIIDAKVSLNAYQDAFAADSEEERSRHLSAHATSMRNHVQQLGAKSYQSQFDEAPDYVVMFVPGEHFVAAALEHDPELWNFAFDRRVLLATPTNLVAIARTVAMVWTQDKLAQEAMEIGKLGTEIYERIATAGEHLKGVGSNLDRAVRKYNDFVGSFERNVQSSARKLRDKGVAIGKREVEDVPLVEAQARHGETLEIATLPPVDPANDEESQSSAASTS